MMLCLLLLNVAEVKKRGERKIDGFRKKSDDSRIWNFGMSRIRSQIKNGKHFCKLKIHKEYSVKIYEIDPYFSEHYKIKYKLMKMDVNTYYLGLIFIFLNISWLQKLIKKPYWQRPYFWGERTRSPRKKTWL